MEQFDSSYYLRHYSPLTFLLFHTRGLSQVYFIVASKEDHSNRDCFAVAVLTHGDVNESGKDVLYGTDALIPAEKLIEHIKLCPSLAGKPKIFIFQVGSVCTFACLCVFKSTVQF